MKKQLCPICESGFLHSEYELTEVEHQGIKGTIKSYYSVCDGCGCEQANAADTRQNKRAMIAFKKQVQGLLTGAEVRKLRKQWQLNQREAARVFGGGPVAFSKYEADDVMQSDAMDKLLRLAAEIPAVMERLKSLSGLML